MSEQWEDERAAVALERLRVPELPVSRVQACPAVHTDKALPPVSSARHPTLADNKHYPNPPGWGLSYHVNGEESPVLEVVRGTTYTFRGKLHLAPTLLSGVGRAGRQPSPPRP